jgi:tetratricopeptide (TPR) repeat protein
MADVTPPTYAAASTGTDPYALARQAEALLGAGRAPDALALLERATALMPGDAVLQCRRGLVLKTLRRWEAALACFERGIALDPQLAPAHMDRGNMLQELGRLEEALAAYERALALQPGFVAALCNRGTVLHRLGRLDAAIASYDAALALAPELDAAHLNRSTALGDAGRTAEALQGFARITARHPGLAVGHWNEALCRLRMGDFERGLPGFEWRWRYAELGLRARAYPQPLWLGQDDIAGRTLFVYGEQGLGDLLQFCRYVPLLAQRGARVLLEAPRPLAAVLATLPGVSHVVTEGGEIPPFDCHTPVMSLPLALGTRLDTIPAPIPYLRADPRGKELWARCLAAGTPGAQRRLRVGLAWSGNAAQPNDYNRSMPLRHLRPLTRLDAEFIALQPEARPGDAPELEAQGIRFFGTDLRDFADTAALAANLDLVISVCTSTAHLAGALGRPLWVLLCHAADWRWLADRDDTPWYPGARLFRQPAPHDWDSVVEQVRGQLQLRLDAAR